MTEPDRILAPDRHPEHVDAALRPKSLDDFVGQRAARENLRMFIETARGRDRTATNPFLLWMREQQGGW